MEPNVSNISHPKHKSDQVPSGAMSVERSSQKKSILGLNQASEQSDFNNQDSSKGIDQRLAGNRG
jgi:hypothetical protein